MPPIPPTSSPARMQLAVPPPTTSQTHSLYSNLTQSINVLVKATLPPTTLGGLLTKLGKCQDETVRLQGRLDELEREKERFEMRLGEVQGALRVATSGRGDLSGNEERAGRQREREGILERLLTENFGEVVDRIESLERELLARLPPKKKGKIVIGNGANGIIADGREKSQDLRTTRDSTVDEREREQVSVSQGEGGARESSPELMRDRSVAIEGQDQEMEVEEDVKPIIPRPREEPSAPPPPPQVTTTQASKNPAISTTEATPTKPIIRQNLPPTNVSSLLGSASARPVPSHQPSSTSQKQSHPLSHSSSSLALLPPSKKARLSPNPSTSLSDRISPSTSSSQAQVQAQANVPTKKQMKLHQREVISLLDDELDEFVSGKDGSATVKKRLPDVPLGAGGLIARLQSGQFAKEGQEEEVVQVPIESEAERHRQWMIKEVEKRDRERIKNEQERIKGEQAKKRNEELKLRLAAEKGKGKVQNGVGEAGTNKNQSVITNKLPPSTTSYDSSLPPSATNRQPRRSDHLPPSNLPSKPTHTIFPASDDVEPSSIVPAVQIQRPPPNHSASSLAVPPNQSRPSSSSTSTVPASKPALSFSLPAQNRPPPAVNFNSSPVSAPVNPVPAPTPVTVPRSANLLERLKPNPNGLNQASFTPAKSKVGSKGLTPEAVKVGQTASMPRDGANGVNGANGANGANGTLKNQANVNLSTAPSSTLNTNKTPVVPNGPASQMRPGPAWLYEDAQKAKQLLTQSQSIPLHPRNAKPSPAPLPPSTLPAVSKPSLYATVQLNSLTPQQDKFKAQKSNNPPPPQVTLPIPTEPFTFAKRSFPNNPAPPDRSNFQSNHPVLPSTSAVLTHNLPPPSFSSVRPNLPSKPSFLTQAQAEAQSKAEKASTLNSTQPKPVSVPIAQPAPLPSTSTSAATALRPRSPSPRSPEEVRRQLGLPTRGRSRSRSRSRSFSPMNISKSSSPPLPFQNRLPLSSQRPRPKSPVRRSRSPLPPRRRSRSRSPHFERRRRSYSPRRRRSRSISRSPLSSSPPPQLRRSRSPEFVSPEIIRRREIGRARSRSPPRLVRDLLSEQEERDRFGRRYSPEPRPSRPAWMDRGRTDTHRGRGR